MKTMIMVIFLFLTGMIFLPGCAKETKISVPVSLTDKDGNIFIHIDTLYKSFDAYSPTNILKGSLTGIFSDTIRSSFYLAITTKPYWDTVYHTFDTIVFPTHYPSHSVSMQADIDLTGFCSPYHFLLLGLPETQLKPGAHGTPSIMLTIEKRTE
jgi:hypothetical protein